MSRTTTGSRLPELPSVEPGVTLLQCHDGSPRLPLHTLAVDQLLLEGGTATWIGTGRHCLPETVASVAPHRRVLDRVQIARGFTPYQHTALLRELPRQVTEETAVVVPEVDYYYRGDDVRGVDGQTMFVRALAALGQVAREHDLPVVCTRTAADSFSDPLEALATATIDVTNTEQGPRFDGDGFETLVYPLGNGWVQTTLAYWQDILAAREPLHAESTPVSEVSVHGAH